MTASGTFERIVAASPRLDRRPQQDQALRLAAEAVHDGRRVFIQAPTGVGKSYVALATAADAGRPGAPGIVATVTNSLGDQYLRDCHTAAVAGNFTYTRIMGRTHYACASSPAGIRAGLPTADDEPEDPRGWRDRARDKRDEWLDSFPRHTDDLAVADELTNLVGAAADMACPGFPDCDGGLIGGCGARRARERCWEVAVVITNFHVLIVAHRYPYARVLPLDDAACLVVDEAHELPGTLEDELTGYVGTRTGSVVLRPGCRTDECDRPGCDCRALGAVSVALREWVATCLGRAIYPGASRYDTEGEVQGRRERDALVRFLSAWQGLPEDTRARLTRRCDDEPGVVDPSVVLARIQALATTGAPGSVARAWTVREPVLDSRGRWDGAWRVGDMITVRDVDAAARMAPDLMPPAAVLMSATVGASLPARLGLPDAVVHDLGQVFDWSAVTGFVSPEWGVKTGARTEVMARNAIRGDHLAAFVRRHRGVLVLANANADIRTVADLLRTRVAHRVFEQKQPGAHDEGSRAAERIKDAYVEHIRGGGAGVLVGVRSYGTGLDLPGELCTGVAWWQCHPGVVSYYDRQVAGHYGRHGDAIDEAFRSRFSQGLGRLLRTPDDRGEVMVCDRRAHQYLAGATGPIDRHLNLINWNWAGVA